MKEPEVEVKIDEDGSQVFGNEAVGWKKISDTMEELDMGIEKYKEDNVLKAFPDALLDDGDQIYIRKSGGRLQWIKANVHGGGESWQELTPTIAKHLENGGKRKTPLEQMMERAEQEEMLRKLGSDSKKFQPGWYQDSKGNLYQHDGKSWLTTNYPTYAEAEKFEYLG